MQQSPHTWMERMFDVSCGCAWRPTAPALRAWDPAPPPLIGHTPKPYLDAAMFTRAGRRLSSSACLSSSPPPSAPSFGRNTQRLYQTPEKTLLTQTPARKDACSITPRGLSDLMWCVVVSQCLRVAACRPALQNPGDAPPLLASVCGTGGLAYPSGATSGAYGKKTPRQHVGSTLREAVVGSRKRTPRDGQALGQSCREELARPGGGRPRTPVWRGRQKSPDTKRSVLTKLRPPPLPVTRDTDAQGKPRTGIVVGS